MESDRFLFEDLQWDSERSRSIGGSGRVVRTLAGASVTCKDANCGHQWHAVRGNGHGDLDLVPGNVLVSCPACGVQEGIPGGKFRADGS